MHAGEPFGKAGSYGIQVLINECCLDVRINVSYLLDETGDWNMQFSSLTVLTPGDTS
jgi:hypothetical protein